MVGFKNYPLNSKFSVKIVTNLKEFKSLGSVWNNLAEKQGSYSPFLTHEWYDLWLDLFLENTKLFILLLCKDGEVVSIAPFCISKQKFKSIEIEKIEFIGNVYSPIKNFIYGNVTNIQKKIYLSYILFFLFDKVSDWDFVDLNAIGYDYEIIDIIKNIADGKKIKYLEQISFVKWYLTDINYTGEEYLKNRSKNIRSEIKRRKKKLEELGALDFKVVNDSDEIDKYMDHYYEVYRKSWKKEENVGPTFHRNLAALGVKKGWLRLGFLFLDGVPIAAQFRFVFNGMCLFIKTSYDEYYKKYSPGIILLSEMTKYIIDTDNVEVIDFGRGDENYKKSWANKKKKIKGMLIFNDNLKGNMLAIFFTRILPFYRKHEALIKIKRILSKNVLKIGC